MGKRDGNRKPCTEFPIELVAWQRPYSPAQSTRASFVPLFILLSRIYSTAPLPFRPTSPSIFHTRRGDKAVNDVSVFPATVSRLVYPRPDRNTSLMHNVLVHTYKISSVVPGREFARSCLLFFWRNIIILLENISIGFREREKLLRRAASLLSFTL